MLFYKIKKKGSLGFLFSHFFCSVILFKILFIGGKGLLWRSFIDGKGFKYEGFIGDIGGVVFSGDDWIFLYRLFRFIGDASGV